MKLINCVANMLSVWFRSIWYHCWGHIANTRWFYKVC